MQLQESAPHYEGRDTNRQVRHKTGDAMVDETLREGFSSQLEQSLFLSVPLDRRASGASSILFS